MEFILYAFDLELYRVFYSSFYYVIYEVSFLENKMSTRALTEGALMAGLAVIFALLGLVPLIGSIAILICGIPITIVTARQGSFTGGMAAILATILIALFLGPLSALSYGLQNLLLGFVIGYLLHKRKSGAKIMQAGIATSALASLVIMLISFALMGFSPESIAAYLAQTEEEMMTMYESTGMLDAMAQQQGISVAEITAMVQSMAAMMVKLSPSFMMISGAITAVVTYWLTMIILKRLKVRIPRSVSFSNWRLPFASIWVIIVVWALWLFSNRITVEWLNILVMNGMIVCAAALLVNGLAAGLYLYPLSQMSSFMKITTVFMLFMFFTGAIIALIILGIADLLFDFRKKKVDNSKVG